MLHQPVRTQIISLLAKEDMASFKMLKERFELTDGNLASHIKKLLEAHYIEEIKFFEDKKPKTVYKISPLGMQAFLDYINALKEFLDAR
ncbi:MAG: hypothetical protein KU37_10565 [Sulfuricurvum sp. PC08-66]|nr:MAG: hypothetical protein KU37_10565 [Sulfuricurvum sp. PC08-66]